MKALLLALAAVAFAPAAARAATLPAQIAPGAPFPRISEQAPTIESIAPGVEYGEYLLDTSAGPIAIHVVAVAPHRSDVRVSDVLASDALQSRGETIGSMAKRTGAIAGLNGDYFDIGNTNRPLNVVVRDGVLLQMPRKRYALAYLRDGYPQITEFSFTGQIEIGAATVPLDGVNALPAPNGGTVLLTPDFGSVAAEDDLTLVALTPLGGTPPISRYRVTSIADNLKTQPPGYYAAIGPNAYGSVDVPSPGDVVSVTGDLQPIGLGSVATAIGGGPLILHGGAWYDDPDGPRGGEYDKRIPCSGAAIAPDGTLFLIEVDGRQASVSVGLKRPEFAALMRALGATEGMAFDGGGSSTMVARRLGDAWSSIVNSPSDGVERPVADGVFVYSTDPVGPAVRLVAQPGIVRAIPGASVRVRVAALDAASHVATASSPVSAAVDPPALGTFANGTFVARRAGRGRIVLRDGALRGAVALEVSAKPARVQILPLQANVDRGGSLDLTVRALDPHGYALALPPLLHWKTTSGTIDALGHFRAAAGNAGVAVRIGGAAATARITVGSHDVAIPFAQRAHYTTIARGGQGSVVRDPQCGDCVRMTYSFGNGVRAAYATADLALPADTIGLSFDVLDDGSGSRLKV
ncbi:MAG TPA: phosphodiester glycosidase family protein, partial [Candidatus Tumulicola sp.]|nr:phosphodiester glycosidase family protein [Candidatus Tumulicola sp.]